MERFLENNVAHDDVIVSGRSPANRGDNVDCWAEDWAKKKGIRTLIFPPLKPTREEYFRRNRLIAVNSDILFVFVPKGVYRSGAWNTVAQFKGEIRIVDENGRVYRSKREWSS